MTKTSPAVINKVSLTQATHETPVSNVSKGSGPDWREPVPVYMDGYIKRIELEKINVPEEAALAPVPRRWGIC